MKNTALILLCSLFFIGCDNQQKAIGDLSTTETETLSTFSDAIETGLLAVRGDDLLEPGNTKMTKGMSDWLNDCDYKDLYDGKNRKSGGSVNGSVCPTRGQWNQIDDGVNRETISIAYTLMNSNFGDSVPLQRFQIRGVRMSSLDSSSILTTTSYTGSAVDMNGNSINFTASRTEAVWSIRVVLPNKTITGRIAQDGSTYVNATKITAEEFQTLFFVLK